jgi:uncharacterized membrane protein YheB (UPF0754 family)
MKPWLLLWIIPPLAGAIIGYITNVVAIRMLFRPLKAIRVFGIRLPFTPGILPRQRHQLAESIGRMVERELLTPEIIRVRLAQEDVRRNVRERIAGYTEHLFSLPLKQILNPAVSDGANPVISGDSGSVTSDPSSFSGIIAGIMGDFFKSPNFDQLFTALVCALMEKTEVQNLLNRSIPDLLETGDREQLVLRMEKFIIEELRSRAEHISAQLIPVARNSFPRGADHFIRFLNRSDIHGELEVQGRIFLSNAILRLNVFQRFFISAGQYDRTLQDRMPEIVDDLIGQLETLSRDNSIRDRLIGLGADALKSALSDEGTARTLARFASSMALTHADMTLGELLEHLGAGTPDNLSRKILGMVRKGLSPETVPGNVTASPQSAVQGLFFSLQNNLGELPRGSLVDFLALNPEKKAALDTLLSDKLLLIADNQIEGALASINVQTLVSQRIDSLDMIRVERIVLDVMANQLKWIDIFGAILGFGIGVFQAALSWLLR